MSGAALVTGATGFLGRALKARLERAGRTVIAPGRGELSTAAAAAELLRRAKPRTIFHLAADARPDASIDELLEPVVGIGARLAHHAREAGVERFVAAGSFFTRRSGGAEYDPVSPYAAAKKALEDLLAWYASDGLRAASVCLYDVYGPGDSRPKLLNALADSARTGRKLELTPGEQELDLLHVDDAADALIAAEAALGDAAPGRLHEWCAASGERRTLRRLLAEFKEATGLEPAAALGAKAYRPREVMRPWAGPAVPGWKPRIPLKEGLRRVYGAAARA